MSHRGMPVTRAVRETRRKFALERDAERAKRSTQEQIDRLDARLGKGQGAVRERARLAAAGSGSATAKSKSTGN